VRLFTLLCLLLLTVLPAEAAGWARHENRDLIGNDRAGWALETPADWVAIPDVRPAWPLGAGFRAPSGQSGVVVTWSARVPEGELEVLSGRGFQETEGRVAGHPARIFCRSGPEGLQRLAYLALPQGTFRVRLFGATEGFETLDRVLASFQLLRGVPVGEAERWTHHQDPTAGYTLSYPADWTMKTLPEGFALSDAAGPAVRVTVRPAGQQPGQSFRGFARSMGKDTIPGATLLERFEPRDVAGLTGYLAVWRLQDGGYCGPIAYLPLKGSARALELVLLRPEAGEGFFRIVDSFHPVAPSQASP